MQFKIVSSVFVNDNINRYFKSLLIARLIIKLLAELAYVKTVRSQNRPDWWSCMTQGAWA